MSHESLVFFVPVYLEIGSKTFLRAHSTTSRAMRLSHEKFSSLWCRELKTFNVISSFGGIRALQKMKTVRKSELRSEKTNSQQLEVKKQWVIFVYMGFFSLFCQMLVMSFIAHLCRDVWFSSQLTKDNWSFEEFVIHSDIIVQCHVIMEQLRWSKHSRVTTVDGKVKWNSFIVNSVRSRHWKQVGSNDVLMQKKCIIELLTVLFRNRN